MSTFPHLLLTQLAVSTDTVQPIPFSGVPGGEFFTDPDFYYDPISQTLFAPNISGGGGVIAGDIEFTKEANHAILVLPSTTTGADGGILTINGGGDGAAATGTGDNAGDGGDTNLEAGTGGAASGTDLPGVGGDTNVFGGFGGDGSADVVPGKGGDVNIAGGNAGVDGGFGGFTGGDVNILGGAGKDGGDVNIDAGDGTGGTDGIVFVGANIAESVRLGRSGKLTTVEGKLTATELAYFKAEVDLSGNVVFDESLPHTVIVATSTTIGLTGGLLEETGAQGGPADATTPGGTGGQLRLFGGKGGTGSAAQLAGAGADAILRSGAGGTTGGLGGNNSGDVIVDNGAASVGGTNGTTNIGTVNANALNLGRAGKLTTINGNLKNAQGIIGHDLQKVFGDSGYTSLLTDDVIEWTTTGGACVQNLPALAGVRGQKLFVSKITSDANTLSITPNGVETISGGAAGAALVLEGGARGGVLLYAPLAGTDWTVLAAFNAPGTPVGVNGGLGGIPTNSQIILRSFCLVPFTLPAGLTGSFANSLANSTGNVTCAIDKITAAGATSHPGTINFTAGSKVGTFTFAAATSWAVGDELRVIAPVAADATLTDIAFGLLGVRV